MWSRWGVMTVGNRLIAGLARWRVYGFLVIGLSTTLLLVFYGTASRTERLFWKAEQLGAAILDDSSRLATPGQVSQAIEAFERVIRSRSGTTWAAKSYLAIGSLYARRRQYGRARAAFAQVLRRFSHQETFCLAARYGITKTFEAEGNLAGAVAMYEEIAFRHPDSAIGLEAPLSIARAYERRHDAQRTDDAYRRAVRAYVRRAIDASSREVRRMARGYLALAYSGLGQLDHSTRVLEALLNADTGADRPFVLLGLETIRRRRWDPPIEAAKTSTEPDESSEALVGSSSQLALEPLAVRLIPAKPQAGAGPTSSH